MTSKKNSKNSLKRWVLSIKYYEYELPNLYDKLEYLEVKSIGYNSPSFSPRISSSHSSNYKGFDYWLGLIDECERKIELYETEIEKYYKFKDSLSTLEQTILHEYFYKGLPPRDIIYNKPIKRYVLYNLINSLSKKRINFKG